MTAGFASVAWFALIGVLLGGGPLCAQDVVTPDPLKPAAPGLRESVPDAPPGMVLDEGGIFDEASGAALSRRLTQFRDQDEFFIYISTHLFLTGEDPNQRAERLAGAWLKEKFGAVIVHDRSQGIGMACSQGAGKPLTNQQLLGMLHRATEAAAPQSGQPERSRLIRAAEVFVEEFTKAKPLIAESRRWLQTGQWKIVALTAGTALVALSLLVIVGRLQKRRASAVASTFLFPDVAISTRLGAPHGGGVMSHIQFDAPR